MPKLSIGQILGIFSVPGIGAEICEINISFTSAQVFGGVEHGVSPPENMSHSHIETAFVVLSSVARDNKTKKCCLLMFIQTIIKVGSGSGRTCTNYLWIWHTSSTSTTALLSGFQGIRQQPSILRTNTSVIYFLQKNLTSDLLAADQPFFKVFN